MKIFISQNISIIKSYNEKADTLSAEWTDYFLSLRPDILLIPIPNQSSQITKLFQQIQPDGLILSNGNDLNEFEERDRTEKKLIRTFLKNNKPILGICRGMQILNTYFGGEVTFNKNTMSRRKHVNANHLVIIKNFLITNKKIDVNSFHNFIIKEKNVPKNFKIFAKSEENIVEGFYDLKRNIYGIQWHPERENNAKRFNKILINHIFKKKVKKN